MHNVLVLLYMYIPQVMIAEGSWRLEVGGWYEWNIPEAPRGKYNHALQIIIMCLLLQVHNLRTPSPAKHKENL